MRKLLVISSWFVVRSLIAIFLFSFLLPTTNFQLPTVYAQSPAPAFTACDSKDINSHEQALCNLNQGLLPTFENSQSTSEQKGFIEQIISKISELAALLGFKPKQPQTFIPRADTINKADLPEINCTIEDKNKEVSGVAFDLGTSLCPGAYNSDLPGEVQSDAQTTKLIEDLEAKSLFPEGIDPFGD